MPGGVLMLVLVLMLLLVLVIVVLMLTLTLLLILVLLLMIVLLVLILMLWLLLVLLLLLRPLLAVNQKQDVRLLSQCRVNSCMGIRHTWAFDDRDLTRDYLPAMSYVCASPSENTVLIT